MGARLREQYNKEIRAQLKKDLNLVSLMDVPRITKIVLNTGVGDATKNSAAIEDAVEIMERIAGQKVVVAKSKVAVSAFKLRENMEIGVYVTLRGDRMWEFLDKLINVVMPRTKDFRGLPSDSFDGQGNYSMGITEHTVFPEIDPNKVQKLRGLQITIVTTAGDDKKARELLSKFGFPFRKDGKEV